MFYFQTMVRFKLFGFLIFNFLILITVNCQTKTGKTTNEISHDLMDNEIINVTEPRNNALIDNTLSIRRQSPKLELRGVWVSTVQRVDFPSKATTDPQILKKEWLTLLKFYKSLNLNAVIVQVRPSGDAIYPSKIVPFTKWITGKSGKNPDGNFDLLKFMIETAHSNGMEFHAWVNPYRAIIDGDTTDLDLKHPFRAHPDWIIKYGREYMLNPGIPEVWKYLTNVVGEIVKNYDVDAIHFDDYFYPYRIAGEDLPDVQTFKRYQRNHKNINDWRRSNTDSLIFNVKKVIKKYKPKVQLGVSPFAVWRNLEDSPEGSLTKAYQRGYDDLYADVLNWLKKGWLDYVAPEIYFHIGHPLVDYNTILDWWEEHSYGANLYISHAIYKVNRQEKYPEWSDSEEILRQLDLARSKSKVKGLVFFSSKWLILNELGVTDKLRESFFYNEANLPIPLSINGNFKDK